MDWMSLLSSIAAAILTGGGITAFLHRKENKRAKQLENETTASSQWRELYERAEARAEALSAKVDELYKKLGYIRDQNNGLTTQNAVLKILKCKRIECSDRQPPIGKKGECNFRINTSEQPESDSLTLDEQQTD
jgi:hypothetical protein